MTRLFISHASEDKAIIARPLAERLRALGEEVWYDEYVLTIGDSLGKEIDAGLARCDFGVVVLSPNFFAKDWPRKELDALFAREAVDRQKRVLPIWHNLDATDIAKHSPLLAARLGVQTSKGINTVVTEIQRAINRPGGGATVHGKAPVSAAGTAWQISVAAPFIEVGDDGRGGLRVRAKATFVNKGTRAAVLSFQLRYELEPGDPGEWLAIPEGEKHENERLRVEGEGFSVRNLFFHLTNPEAHGGADFFRDRQARLWITDHISEQKALVSLPTPS